jgi:hypothetical protein
LTALSLMAPSSAPISPCPPGFSKTAMPGAAISGRGSHAIPSYTGPVQPGAFAGGIQE